MPYFSQNDIETIREDKRIGVHNDETILEDFISFVEENTLTFSFKLVFLINALLLADVEGNINLTTLTEKYADFYVKRLKNGLPVDKKNCIYNLNNLSDFSFVKKSLLDNPFEKFERKRFFYFSKDLNIISFNCVLWSKMTNTIKKEIINKELKFLKDYYDKYGGYNDGYQF